MKFVAVLSAGADALEKFTVVPPCKGYYTNLSIQIINQQWSEDGVIEDEIAGDRFVMCTDKVSDLVWTDLTAVVAGSREILPDFKTKNIINWQIRNPGLDEAGAQYDQQWKHFGKKRIYVNDGDLINLLLFTNDATVFVHYLVQGNFVPTKGAVYKSMYNLGELDTGDDFISASRFVFPTDLNNAQIEFTVQAVFDTAVWGANIYFRLQRRGTTEFIDTIDDGVGDILDTDFVDQDSFSGSGIVGMIPFKTHATDPIQITKVLSFGNVKEGDYVSWDVRATVGSSQTGVVLTGMLAGIIPRQRWCEDADFIQHDAMYDANKDVNGVYTASD